MDGTTNANLMTSKGYYTRVREAVCARFTCFLFLFILLRDSAAQIVCDGGDVVVPKVHILRRFCI